MPAFDADSFVDRFTSSLNYGDLDAVLNMYAPGAIYVVQPGRVVDGKGLRDALAAMQAAGARLEGKTVSWTEAGDIGLLVQSWTLNVPARGGRPPLLREGVATDVLKRDDSGAWKILIDNPSGTTLPATAAQS